MKKLFKNKSFWAVAICLALVAGVTVKSAMAYFTTYVTAKGGYEISLGYESEIEEKVENKQKIVTLKNTGNQAEYVRVKVFTAEELADGVKYSVSYDESDWTYSDGYYVYNSILEPGESTNSAVTVKFEFPSDDYDREFNIVVIQECTSVKLDSNGNKYADWSNVEETTTDIGKGGNS